MISSIKLQHNLTSASMRPVSFAQNEPSNPIEALTAAGFLTEVSPPESLQFLLKGQLLEAVEATLQKEEPNKGIIGLLEAAAPHVAQAVQGWLAVTSINAALTQPEETHHLEDDHRYLQENAPAVHHAILNTPRPKSDFE